MPEGFAEVALQKKSDYDLVDIKFKLGNLILSLIENYDNSYVINNICDELISNYIALSLFKNGKIIIFSDFLIFIRKISSINEQIYNLIYENKEIWDFLNQFNFFENFKNPYKLAEGYQKIKSNIIKKSKNEINIKENLSNRKSTGLFYTPPSLVKFIVNNTIENRRLEIENNLSRGKFLDAIDIILNQKIADIACGTGSFLVEMIYTLKEIRDEILKKIDVEIIKEEKSIKIIQDEKEFLKHIYNNCLFGIDTDKNAVLLCAFNIFHHCSIPENIQTLYGNHVKVGNSLTGNVSENTDDLKKIFNDFYEKGVNWRREFKKVFSRENPGFDLIIMNPPYGKVRLESYKGSNKNQLVKDTDRERFKLLSQFYRESNFYTYSIYGVLNFYKLMTERATNLIRKGGSLGFIVPNTLLNDLSTVNLRKHLFNKMNVKIIVEIPENNDFFENITQAFCIFVLSKERFTKEIKIKRNVIKKEDLIFNDFISIDFNLIRDLFPNLLNIPNTNEFGLSLLEKIYKHGKLSDYEEVINSRGEVDLTKYSKIISFDKNKKRIIRGYNIKSYQINENINSKPTYIDKEKFIELLGNSPKLSDIPKERLICKQIANQNKKKRLEFAITKPYSILGNSCNYISLKNGSDPPILRYLLGFLNSLLVEWRFRITSTNNHVNNYEIDDFPLYIPKKENSKNYLVNEIGKIAKKIENMKDKVNRNELEAKINYLVFKIFDLNKEEMEFIIKSLGMSVDYMKEIKNNEFKNDIPDVGIYNHVNSKLSDLDMKMVYAIPQGGNWRDIPEDIESERVQQIRRTGGRTTYYGRLRWDKPSYTINTYFTRVGNGCFIHPEQHRLISLREGARLQSFPDSFIFYGSKSSMYKQIGNAVPPLMAYQLGKLIKSNRFIDLFCGAGGFSLGIEMAGSRCELALDFKEYFCETYRKNHNIDEKKVLSLDIKNINMEDTFSVLDKIDLVIGGPPCQGFSTAGNNLLDDPRNELVKYFIKAVEIIRPEYFVMENVVGLTYKKREPFMDALYTRFKEAGYSVRHKILLSADYGVPQKRHRVFFIGNIYNKKISFPKPLFSENGNILPKYITVRKAISDLPPIEMNGGVMEKIPYPAEPESNYQKLMRGIITFEQFYNNVLNKSEKKIRTLEEFI